MATEDTILIQINSSLRNPLIGSDTDANFGFSVPDGVIRRIPKRIKVFSAAIPFAWNSILSSNNKFSMNDGITTYNIVVPSQNYSATTLAAQIALLLNNTGSLLIFSVIVDTITNKMTISATAIFTLYFNVVDSIGPLLGYGTSVYSGAISYAAFYIMNMVYDGYININSNVVSGKDNGTIILGPTDIARPPVLTAVPITGDYGCVIFYQSPPELEAINIENSLFSNRIRDNQFPVILDFQLTSPTGVNIDMNGVSWSMVLQFFYN